MARPKRGEILSLTIDDLAFGGEGVGRADGYVVFVPGGLPGDRLRVRLVQVRSRFGRGVIDAIEEPSPQRVEAPCPYFGHCGGCRLQHMAYPAQLAFKAKQVVDALERLGGLKGIEVRPIIGATETFGYRNKMEFTVARGAKEPLVVGLHEADRYDSVLDIDRCLLQSDRMNALLGEARAFFVERGLTVYDQDSGEGLLRFLMLREGTHTGELMANVVTSAPAVSELAPVAPRLQARDAGTTSVVMNVNPKKASVAVGVEEHLLGGRDHIRERVGGLTFQVSASSFFQTNTRQAERLFELVLDSAGLTGTETVYDLYSGTGAISLLLARRARWVYGVEVAQAAVDDAGVNAAANGITNCTFVCGEVRFVLPSLIAKGVTAEVVVADPPRAGFHPKALHALITLGARRIVYVSCNPTTLARDLGELVRGGYRLEWVQPVDMFPHTPAHRGGGPAGARRLVRSYLLRRLWQSLLVLFGVSVVVFLILHLTGDPGRAPAAARRDRGGHREVPHRDGLRRPGGGPVPPLPQGRAARGLRRVPAPRRARDGPRVRAPARHLPARGGGPADRALPGDPGGHRVGGPAEHRGRLRLDGGGAARPGHAHLLARDHADPGLLGAAQLAALLGARAGSST